VGVEEGEGVALGSAALGGRAAPEVQIGEEEVQRLGGWVCAESYGAGGGA